MENDAYKTIEKPSEETLFKDRNSKFFGYSFPIKKEDDVKEALKILKKKHHAARHFCYAWKIGIENPKFRANDDGEPSNSAGMPIYGQIQSFNLTNILIISVRYFGGTKLGIGGLINAYKTSAQLVLEASEIVEKTINIQYQLSFGYDMMNKVMRIIKEKRLKIIKKDLALDCKYVISVREKEAVFIFTTFTNLYKISIKKLDS